MTSTYTDTEMPNFDSILSHYGLAKTDGIVVEGNRITIIRDTRPTCCRILEAIPLLQNLLLITGM